MPYRYTVSVFLWRKEQSVDGGVMKSAVYFLRSVAVLMLQFLLLRNKHA